MPKDFANIYNLTEEDFKAETQNLWKDAIPGTLELANNLLKKIEDDEYPYVLSVEASYGMGKTYFFSRFCEHAKKNGYHCIYKCVGKRLSAFTVLLYCKRNFELFYNAFKVICKQ